MDNVNVHIQDSENHCESKEPSTVKIECENCHYVEIEKTYHLIMVCNSTISDFISRIEFAVKEYQNNHQICIAKVIDKLEKFKEEYEFTKRQLDIVLTLIRQRNDCDEERAELEKLISSFGNINVESLLAFKYRDVSYSCCNECKSFLDALHDFEKALKDCQLGQTNELLKRILAIQTLDKIKTQLCCDNSKDLCATKSCSKKCCIVFLVLGIILVGLPIGFLLHWPIFPVCVLYQRFAWILALLFFLIGSGMLYFCVWKCYYETKRIAEFEKKKKEEMLRIISRLTY